MIKALKTFLLICLLFLICIFPSVSCKKKTSLSKYDISLTYNDGEIYGKCVYKFINHYNQTFNKLKFNLFANAYKKGAINPPVLDCDYPKAYPFGESFGCITIESVKVENSPAEFTVYGSDGQFLEILTGEIYPNESKEVEINFKTVIPKSLLRLGINDKSINLGDFFPTACKIENDTFKEISYYGLGDPYFSECANYSVSITLPSTYTVASSGTPTLTEIGEFGTTYSYELQSGRDFAFVLSENFNVTSQKVGNLTINYYHFDDNGQQILDTIIDCVQYFSKTFGNLQISTLSVAQTPFLYGGMEYSGLCVVNSNLTDEDFKYSLIHEIAHQWWHGGVGCDGYTQGFIDEGLAEYSTYLYLSNTYGKNYGNEMIENTKLAYKSFFNLNSLLSGDVDTSMIRELHSYKSLLEYVNITYNKSLLMFYEYEQAIGKSKTISKLKKLYQKYVGKEIDLYKLTQVLGLKEHFYSFAEGKVII